MLKSLRIRFVLVIVALVGLVLVSVLGGSFLSASQAQADMIDDALEHALNSNVYDRPRLGLRETDQDPAKPRSFIVLTIDVDQNWVVIATNDANATIDATVLADVLQTVRDSDQDSGRDDSLDIEWRRALHEDGSWRVAIADTSSVTYILRSLAIKDLVIVIVAMLVLLVIAIGLSTWMLKPIQQAWDQQRRFVADASHELKTPLAVIIANTQILSKDDGIPADSQRWIQSTADESAHMKNLVEELLELARTDESSAGTQGVMQHQEVDFSNLVESASLEFDAIAFERGSEIHADIAPDLTVNGDPEWLERLVKILIDNATKYSKGGEPISVSLVRDGRRCVLSVNNHGNTIDPEDLAHIFDRFYRTDKARSRDSHTGGFGLGLAIAQGIATSHGGTIAASSSDETGTTFTVTLPLS